MKKVKSYGSWKSPITADKVASGKVGLSEIKLGNNSVYWLETRPGEDGRTVLVTIDEAGNTRDVTPEGFNVRNRVHEYGGGSYEIGDEAIYFSNFEDQRVYRLDFGQKPGPISPEASLRYADYVMDGARSRLISVCEDHTGEGEAENYLASLDVTGSGSHTVLSRGHDFYAAPRISPLGDRLAWITWDHPRMPWDGTSLHVGELNGKGKIENEKVVAGGEAESVIVPKWNDTGLLYFVSDRSGWWNIYRWNGNRVSPVTERRAEFGGPGWQFGLSTFDFPGQGEIVYTYTEHGRWFLGKKALDSGEIETYDVDYTQIASLKAAGDRVFFLGGGPQSPSSIVEFSRRTKKVRSLKTSTSFEIEESYISIPDSIKFESDTGEAHGFFYRPKNRKFQGPESEKPPLLVISHGGPTSSTCDTLSHKIQFWTTRGFAVLDVNYRGSTGFGRDYREKLKGNWGLVDVEDCANGALYLAENDEVDRDRLIIRGGSAGGYTTLASLAFTDVFRAGASYYGVSDPVKLTESTHKFESRYLDGLIGPYPEEKKKYEDRSPIKHQEDITSPVIFFQGEEDRVVPPSQAEDMYRSLVNRGIPTAYLLFEGEQHGFRKEKNIRRALEAEMFFYAKIFGFDLVDDVERVSIENIENAGPNQ